MNCQDISQLVDTCRSSGRDKAELRAAEAHVRTCRSCAAVWGAHWRLAEVTVPPMPAELRQRCRELVRLPVQAQGAGRSRRLVLIGGLLAVAAAAAILIMFMHGAPAPESLFQTEGAGSRSTPALMPAVVSGPGTSADAVAQEETSAAGQSASALPLLPVPAEPDNRAMKDLALQKLVQRHPELVEGPALEGKRFLGGIAMRPDGDVIASAVRLPDGIDAYELDHEISRLLPTDGGITQIPRRPKGTVLPDGRTLRADLTLNPVVVPANYNASRSTNRVREILGDRYNHLLLPNAGGMLNRLTILLAPDGTVLKESVELERQTITYRETRSDDPKDVARVAESRAKALGIDVDQIGLMGSTRIEDGTIKLVANGTPGGFVDDRRRELLISYVWRRGSGESSPTLGQRGVAKPPVDLASALTIVERQIPEAFTTSAEGPDICMVVMAANGEFVRAGRVQRYGGAEMNARQLVPGVKITSSKSVRLTNKDDVTVDVLFFWEHPATSREKLAN